MLETIKMVAEIACRRKQEIPARPIAFWNIWILNGGRYRIRTYDFHRVKVALYR